MRVLQSAVDVRAATVNPTVAVRLYDLPPSSSSCPPWLLKLATAISGQVLNPQGVLEPISQNRAEMVEEVRQELESQVHDNDWAVWGRWFLGDRATRTISPFSKVTVPEYIKVLVEENTPESLLKAESLAYGNPELANRIARAKALLRANQQPVTDKTSGS